MATPQVSIITVVFNDALKIEETILSVIGQSYLNFEYIIIDGGSKDGTVEIIKKYKDKISLFVSQPDKGVYDAMNKGIGLAKGEWINFMNSGDRFSGPDVLKKIFEETEIPDEKSFLYSDWYFCDYLKKDGQLYYTTSSFEKGNILHQSSIYKKELHDRFGSYLLTPKLIVSDYIFFNLIPVTEVLKVDVPISVNDRNGLSNNSWCFEQKHVVDFLFGRINLSMLLKIFVIYLFKTTLIKWKKRFL